MDFRRWCADVAWCAGSTPTDPSLPPPSKGPVCRAAGSQRRLQPGLGLRRARRGGGPRPGSGPPPETRTCPTAPPGRMARRGLGSTGAGAVPVRPRHLPRPLRRARQGLDGPRPGPLAGPLLGRRHRHGRDADAARRVDQGLGALFFGIPPARHQAVRRAHGIPANRRLVGVVALGHELRRTEGSSRTRPRRSTAEVVHWGHFRQPEHGVSGEWGRAPSRRGTRLGGSPRRAGTTARSPHTHGPKTPAAPADEELRRADRRHRRRGGDAGGVPRVRLLGHLLPRPARRPRRAQAGPAPDPVHDVRDGAAPRPRPREVAPASSAT